MPIHHRFHSRLLAGAACALLLGAGSTAALAQTSFGGRAIGPGTAPAPNPAAATANALPSPGGLRSPLITPGGITTAPPAGLPSAPTDTAGAGRPIPTDATAGGGNGGVPGYGGAGPATNVMGGPGFAGPVATGAGPYATVDIARSYLAADSDRSGDLTRSEAQRLSISPVTFEEMDRDGNGRVTRWEYEDAVRAR
jgi:hypothetical protein